jgi:hypothetical protein
MSFSALVSKRVLTEISLQLLTSTQGNSKNIRSLVQQQIFTGKSASKYNRIQGVAIECHDCQIAVLMNGVEYKKHKKLPSTSSKITFNIRILHVKNYVS